MTDVVVVGGGVAGSAAALHLARRGHAVVLLERGEWPREKVCGEGLMPHGVAELAALGLLDAVDATGARPFHGIAWHARTASAEGRFPHGAGRGVRRLHLDRVLAHAAAREPGVDARTASVRDLTVDADGVTVRTDRGDVRARAVVGADGRASLVRRRLGLQADDRRPPRYGVRGHFRLAGPEGDLVTVHLADAGELYVTPTGPGEVNVALLCDRDVTRRAGGDLTALLAGAVAGCRRVAAQLAGSEPLTPAALVGPLRRVVSGVVHDRGLLVGDAAGFVDAITGEGMSTGLVSARLAADALDVALRADALRAGDLRGYARRYRREVRDPTRLTELVLWGIRRPWLAERAMAGLGRHPELFGRVLAVNTGQSPLSSVGFGGLIRLLTGW